MLAPVLLSVYIFSHAVILLFAFGQLALVFHALRRRRQKSITPNVYELPETLPFVTVQLPIYNERHVVERLLDAVAALDYPKDRFEIQVLDDSTDETSALIAAKIFHICSTGTEASHIQRAERTGFKAGALQHGLLKAKGEFIAIFDADFVPPPSFLKTVLPQFQSDNIGMVQTRWSHLNEAYSILTELQAFGLDAHFGVEQEARNAAGLFINFNGTAGVWRKRAIEDAGGWQADTLTEDLDLSYRAQLNGWRFKFLGGVASPAELPAEMSSYKSQQFRWAKGAIETAKKNLLNVWKSNLSLAVKFHATIHLCANGLFILIFISGLLTVPLMIIKNTMHGYEFYFQAMSVFLLSFLISSAFYMISATAAALNKDNGLGSFVKKFSRFIAFMMGMSFHNSIAVLEGLFGRKSAFIRTPKFGLRRKGDTQKRDAYLTTGLTATVVFEIVFALYYVFGAATAIYFVELSLLPFQLLFCAGFSLVAALSIYHARLAKL
jgi:cellulose synthase/poly-beta-1,6-N-acetylglucosamine synthase-like glycosyltransferase